MANAFETGKTQGLAYIRENNPGTGDYSAAGLLEATILYIRPASRAKFLEGWNSIDPSKGGRSEQAQIADLLDKEQELRCGTCGECKPARDFIDGECGTCHNAPTLVEENEQDTAVETVEDRPAQLTDNALTLNSPIQGTFSNIPFRGYIAGIMPLIVVAVENPHRSLPVYMKYGKECICFMMSDDNVIIEAGDYVGMQEATVAKMEQDEQLQAGIPIGDEYCWEHNSLPGGGGWCCVQCSMQTAWEELQNTPSYVDCSADKEREALYSHVYAEFGIERASVKSGDLRL